MPTILVVGDDESTRRLLEAALQEVGDVVSLPDGEAALAWTDDRAADVVVMDVLLPGISGLDVLTAWREAEHTADMDVVLLSAREHAGGVGDAADAVDVPDVPDEAAGYEAGADAYVTKPMDVDVLQGLIGAMLADRAAQRQTVLDEFRNLGVGDFPV